MSNDTKSFYLALTDGPGIDMLADHQCLYPAQDIADIDAESAKVIMYDLQKISRHLKVYFRKLAKWSKACEAKLGGNNA